MDIRQVTSSFAVADQVTEADLATLAGRGIRTLICNRPDGEADGQPSAAQLAAAARELGMAWVWIPISSGQFTEPAIDAFRDALRTQPEPVLAFCRSGTRSITLWALSAALPAGQVLGLASAAGYDLSALAQRLASRQQG
ncbi:protein tyrosine phosphatase family protein [Zobellella taiwanensis]